MGLPANPDANVPQPSAPTNDATSTNAGMPTSSSTDTPSQPAELPPAALELAGKLFELAREGDTATLSQYLQAGIPPNLTNHNGDTLLMLAAYHGHLELVRTLMDKGSDPNIINSRGQSIIAGAVFKGYDEVVKEMYNHGAKIREGTPDAVQTARMFRNKPILDFFGVDESQEPPLPGQVPRGPNTDSMNTQEAQRNEMEQRQEASSGNDEQPSS